MAKGREVSKKERAERKKFTLLIIIVMSVYVGLYVLLCLGVFGGLLIQLSVQQKSAVDTEGGKARYEELVSSGIQRFYSIYTQEEIAKNPALGSVELYYFPNKSGVKDKYLLICPGGGYTDCAVDSEGFPVANAVNEKGYTAFVLKYRVGEHCSKYAPLDDLARAITYINNNADTFNVVKEDYALCGFSAGGNLVGLFGSDGLGYKNYANVTKPSTIILGYPWANTEAYNYNFAYDIFALVLGGNGRKAFLGDEHKALKDTMRLDLAIGEGYPNVYMMQGAFDIITPKTLNGDKIAEALEQYKVPYFYEGVRKVNHGVGIAKGTEADGWIERAVDFWINGPEEKEEK